MDTDAAEVEMQMKEMIMQIVGDDADQPQLFEGELTWHQAVEELAEIDNLEKDTAEQILRNIQAWVRENGWVLVFRAEADIGDGREVVKVEKEHDDEGLRKEDNDDEEGSQDKEGKEDGDVGYVDENQNDGGNGSKEDDSQEENDGKEKDESEKQIDQITEKEKDSHGATKIPTL